ncbi:MAG: LLM class flavin-dependent oxidoreductase, partial [Candidatus Eremiobacterota bacterium]
VATLDQLSRGRVILGLGSGEAMNLEPFGIPWDRKVARLRESVTILRQLLDSTEPFSFAGDFYTLKSARLCVRPWQKRRIPIYLAALGPLMQKLAGQVADGWYPVTLPMEQYGQFFAPLADAARLAGRDPDQIDRVANVPLALVAPGEWKQDAFEQLARMYALTIVWPVALERLGIPWNPPEHLKDVNYITVNPCDPEQMTRYQELQQWVPMEMIERFIYRGELDELARVVQGFIDQGATHFAVSNASPEPLGATAAMCSRLFPRFTGRGASLAARVADSLFPVARRFGLMPRTPNPRDWSQKEL